MIGESDDFYNDIPSELDDPTLQADSYSESDEEVQDNPFIVTSPEEHRGNGMIHNGNLRASWEEEIPYNKPETTYTKRQFIPVRSTKKLTVPKSPHFTKRLKELGNHAKMVDDSEVILTKKRNRTNLFDLTVPKPFKLLTSVRGRDIMPKSPFVSMASRTNNFFNKTPERFKVKPAIKPSANLFQSRLTVPKSPKLRTKVRAKHELHEDVQEIKPRKVRTHLKVNGLTIPRSPNITKVTKRKLIEEECTENKPIPKLTRKWKGATIPKSPNITKPTKRRRIDFDVVDRPAVKVVSKSKRVNGLTIPKSPNITKPRPKPIATDEITRSRARRRKREVNVHMPGITVPEPFHFVGDSIRERKLQRFREKLQREEEEAQRLRQVHANPMLDLEYPDPLPPVEPRPLTRPMPFRLETDLRGDAYQQFLQDKLKQSEKIAKQMAIPRANPMPDFSTVWYPSHSDKAFTVPEEIHLSTEDRIQERHDWEILVKQEKEKNNAIWEAKRQEMAKEKERQLQKFRRTLVHKPVPIPETLYRPDSLQPLPHRNLTIPKSPAIHKKSVKSRKQVDDPSSNSGKKTKRNKKSKA
ncbi:hypothetical protein K7432_001116 [Basidiobolus ranarum]|uniref:TPX2 C-terminal domain-containing protein n=1 Tax=Basidiobolus ranarum TaxID=34480 RepID=A0ABR2X3I4_9FUNG